MIGSCLVLTVSGIDSFTTDPSVMVRAALGMATSTSGSVVPSTVCPTHTDLDTGEADVAAACRWSATASTCSGIAAGQHFDVATDLGTVVGAIAGGRIDFTLPTLPIALSDTATMTLHGVRFGGRITATSSRRERQEPSIAQQ